SRVCCVAIQGYSPHPDEDKVVRTLRVSPHYFETMGITLIRGRDFTPGDSAKAPSVAVINETMARHYFGDANPIGRRFGWMPSTDEFEVIGVVRDARYDALRESTPRLVYQSHLQGGTGGMDPNFVQIRLELGRARPELLREVRRAIEAVDSRLPVLELATLESLIDRTLGAERIVAQLALAFGVLALILTATGLYGVMAFTVAQRTAEIGVRMALGAGRTDAVWLITRETLHLVAAGVAVGLPAAIAASTLLSNQLFGLSPHDPGTLCGAVLMLLAVTLAAGYVPARRASRLDPVNALRCE
ncbi:MAG: FtsX-like permease family protein, partial [Bryobacteraceae bacterium]